jgi:hypothetical protein
MSDWKTKARELLWVIESSLESASEPGDLTESITALTEFLDSYDPDTPDNPGND